MKQRRHIKKKPSGTDRIHRQREKVVDQVEHWRRPVCESEGMELVHVEFQREPGGRILRLYIDKPDGVNLDDCVDISRQMSDMLDVNLEISGRTAWKSHLRGRIAPWRNKRILKNLRETG